MSASGTARPQSTPAADGAAGPPRGRAARALWALDGDMSYLNHGAFGATLTELAAEQERWRLRMERQPARFFMNDLPGLIRESAAALAGFVGADPDRTVMVENVSSGIMTVLTSLRLQPGDRIVITSHVYGAVRQALRHVSRLTGAEVEEVPVPLPVTGPEDFVKAIARALDGRTRLVVVDHVASPSALILPVAEIVALARRAGATVLVDGAHGPGLVDLDLEALDADYYVGNCHKWLCNPRGAAFITLGRSAAAQGELHPLTISHAYGQGMLAEFGKVGTRDATAWLTVPAAVAAHARLGGKALRQRNATLARDGARRVAEVLGTRLAGPAEMFAAMVSLRLPEAFGPPVPSVAMALRESLWRTGRIDVVVSALHGALWLRVCAFAYTELEEFDALAAVLLRLAGSGGTEARS